VFKKIPLGHCPRICQMSTDSQNFFTGTLWSIGSKVIIECSVTRYLCRNTTLWNRNAKN